MKVHIGQIEQEVMRKKQTGMGKSIHGLLISKCQVTYKVLESWRIGRNGLQKWILILVFLNLVAKQSIINSDYLGAPTIDTKN